MPSFLETCRLVQWDLPRENSVRADICSPRPEIFCCKLTLSLISRRYTGTSYIGALVWHSFWEFCTICNCELGEAEESDLALRATGRPLSLTPLSHSASALLDVKASNLAVKVHQVCSVPFERF